MKILCISRKCRDKIIEYPDIDDQGAIIAILDGERDEIVNKYGMVIIHVKDMDIERAIELALRRLSIMKITQLIGSTIAITDGFREAVNDEIKLVMNMDIVKALTNLGQATQPKETTLEELKNKVNTHLQRNQKHINNATEVKGGY